MRGEADAASPQHKRIYGAGDYKLGCILNAKGDYQNVVAAGKRSRAKFLKALPALGKLTEACAKRATDKTRGYVLGLDGRRIFTRSAHASLNSLLQGAGALQMKVALVILDRVLAEKGLTHGVDYEFVANIHDEWQIAVLPQYVELVKHEAAASIEAAGVWLNFKCPLKGNADHGQTWADTH